MKRYEKELLNNLVGGTNIGDEEPLKNVKKALGSLSSVVGNPMFKAEISLNITSFFFTGVGAAIAPAALPAALQTIIPVWLFGLTDFYGGYNKSSILIPPSEGWFRGLTANEGIQNYTLKAPIPAIINVQPGDMLLCFSDVPAGGANFLCWIRIRSQSVTYGTFLNSFVSDLITVNQLRLVVPLANINQLINPLIFGYQTLFGKVSSDSVDPRMYKTPADFQNQICDIPLKFPVDKNLMIGFQLDVFCQQMSIVLFVEKVEPLTHKR